jgi:hypothetical protein
MKRILACMLLSFVLFTGCKKDNTSPVSYTPSCTGAAKSYKNDVAPIIQSACSGCHQNYNTYSQMSASQSSVRSVIVSGAMPKGSSLSTAQKDAIVCWIDNGASNN